MSDVPVLLAQFAAYYSIEETKELCKKMINAPMISPCQFHIALPATYLDAMQGIEEFREIHFGADMMLDTNEKMFTGSIAIPFLQQHHAAFVLIGSKKERAFYRDLSFVNQHIKQALSASITSFVSILDPVDFSNDEQPKSALQEQILAILSGISPEELKNIYLVYDAAWINQTPWDSRNEHLLNAYHLFKEVLEEQYKEESNLLKIIYAIPTYSADVKNVMSSLPAAGYSLGTLSPATIHAAFL